MERLGLAALIREAPEGVEILDINEPTQTDSVEILESIEESDLFGHSQFSNDLRQSDSEPLEREELLIPEQDHDRFDKNSFNIPIFDQEMNSSKNQELELPVMTGGFISTQETNIDGPSFGLSPTIDLSHFRYKKS